MTVVTPTGVKVQGKVNVIWVPTLAVPTAPTATEVNAVGSLDISCYLTAAGFTPSVNTNKGQAPARLCTTVQYEQFGNTTYSLGDLEYVVDPQGATSTTGIKAYTTLAPGTAGWFVVRMGLDAVTSAAASGQFVESWPVTLGLQLITGDTTDEFAEFHVTQPVIVTGPRIARTALAT